jgi:hypothetical protein
MTAVLWTGVVFGFIFNSDGLFWGSLVYLMAWSNTDCRE